MARFLQITILTAIATVLFVNPGSLLAQSIDNNGCIGAGFEIDAGLYSNTVEYGNGSPAYGTVMPADWFYGTGGHGVIDTTAKNALKALLQGGGDPTYAKRMAYNKLSYLVLSDTQTLVDAVFARDNFGGTGFIDATSFNTASKNGEDPAIWDPGPQNVLGKNDMIDIAGHMIRDGANQNSPLWFYGIINRAKPGGDAYMDFEFYIEQVSYTSGSGFTSGGPDLGHTAFDFDINGKISKIGDFLLNTSLVNGGEVPDVELRIWVSLEDRLNIASPDAFDWVPGIYDGAFNGSPYVYAAIRPKVPPGEICGNVNMDGQTPLAPPWGTKNTKYNTWSTTYEPWSVMEMSVNLSHIGLDPAYTENLDPCHFPYHTFMVKTRASASFTAQLKDFAGPYAWGQLGDSAIIAGSPVLSCANNSTMLYAYPPRTDIAYTWTTLDGNIVSNLGDTIIVNEPGTYMLQGVLPNGCDTDPNYKTVGYDPTKPFFTQPVASTTLSCDGTNGSINLSVGGAVGPYTYLWSGPGGYSSTVEDPSGLIPGTYYVTVSNPQGCDTVSGPITVSLGAAMTISPTVSNLDCYGDADGNISVSVTSTSSPFTYLWSNGNTTSSISALTAGTYTVTVTDADGCPHVQSATVTQPAAVSSTAVKVNDTDPHPVNGTGTLTLTPSGGTPGYTYLWSGPNAFSSTDKDVSALDYGSYTVTITDANGCTGTSTYFIYEPEVCNDGIDNDGDGLNNCDDSDCTPPTPGTITPDDPTPCVGDVITYTIAPALPNGTYDSYQWTIPGTATLNSGQGTHSISVTWNSTAGGQICVRGQKYACLSAPSCISVTPHDVPPQPGNIEVD